MTELVLRNFDKAVLGKLKLSAEAREAFRKLLIARNGAPLPEITVPDP